MIVRQPLRSQKFTVVFLTLIFHGGHFSATFEDLLTIRLPDTPGGRGVQSASPRIYHSLEGHFRSLKIP
ncbi:uncharacterized protein LOC142591299 isoform X4 [Dermacentor variabilis]|uniref:uncharacterized protein LOC142591299 isoform X4 n=1 Tax=Dermacentor variabilis TaxID=34621 RepID=UPI003F5BF021